MDTKGLSPCADLGLVRGMRKVFKELSPDVVLSFTIKNNIFGALAARGLPLTFVPNVTGLGTAFLSSRLLRQATKYLYRCAFRPLPHVIFQNEDDRAFFENLHITKPEQAVLVPGSGIDLKRFPFTPLLQQSRKEAVTFLMIGRVLADKGVREYAQAACLLKSRYPNVRFQLLGPCDALNRTAVSIAEVQDWADSGYIEYLGQTDDVRSAIAAADCIVLPSYREGAPRALLEGGAMGRAMVTTDVPGCRSVVLPGETGLLCAPRSAGDLALTLEKIIGHSREDLAAMGRAARADMEDRFSVSHVIEVYCGLLRKAPSILERSTL
jgi:glycosyltransferase involved in cell wall biosynthesis